MVTTNTRGFSLSQNSWLVQPVSKYSSNEWPHDLSDLGISHFNSNGFHNDSLNEIKHKLRHNGLGYVSLFQIRFVLKLLTKNNNSFSRKLRRLCHSTVEKEKEDCLKLCTSAEGRWENKRISEKQQNIICFLNFIQTELYLKTLYFYC